MASSNVQYAALNLKQYADDAAVRNGIPTDYFSRFITTESAWNPLAIGAAGEQGIAQIIPAYHPAITDPLDPYQSIDYAAQTIRGYFDKFGSWSSAFGAWNAGPTRAATGNFPASTRDYINKIVGSGMPSVQAHETVYGSAPANPSMFRTIVYVVALGLLFIGFFGSLKGKNAVRIGAVKEGTA